MFKRVVTTLVASVVLSMLSSTASASTLAQVTLEMGANHAKTRVLDLHVETELHIIVENAAESASWLLYTLDVRKPLEIPGMPWMYRLETVRQDFVAKGCTVPFSLTAKPGKYELALHADEGNCKGGATIS